MSGQTIILTLEPSKRLSELCGFSYLIEKRFTVKELQEQGIINEEDIKEMEQGKQICKHIPIDKGGTRCGMASCVMTNRFYVDNYVSK